MSEHSTPSRTSATGPVRPTTGVPHRTRAARRRARIATRRRRRTRAATTALITLGAAACGTVLALAPGSAAGLGVDGGVIQTWTLPGPSWPPGTSADVTPAPAPGPVSVASDLPDDRALGATAAEAADEPGGATAADSPAVAAEPEPSPVATPEPRGDPGPDDVTGDDSTAPAPTGTPSASPSTSSASPSTSSTDGPGTR